jgi:murein DD-endopeptidase MepM/ murein hydrolase activator NlpD
MKIKNLQILAILFFIILFAACNGAIDLTPEVKGARQKGGIYHSFWRKHTLWLIAEAYGKTVRELAIANQLKTPFDIEIGGKIFIPGATKYRDVDYKDPGWNVMLKSMRWPLEGDIIHDWGDSAFPKGLEGIDINAPEGSIVRAAADGWVVYAGEDFPLFGKMILLDHRYVLASLYGCNSELLVKEGMRVDEGEPIAKVGKCKYSVFPVLHFEVIYFNKRENPHRAFETSYEEMLEDYDRKFNAGQNE